jgi:hypothetical protein
MRARAAALAGQHGVIPAEPPSGLERTFETLPVAHRLRSEDLQREPILRAPLHLLRLRDRSGSERDRGVQANAG